MPSHPSTRRPATTAAWLTLGVTLAALTFAGCGDDGNPTPPTGGNPSNNGGMNNANNGGNNNPTNNATNNATNNGTNNPTNNGTNNATAPFACGEGGTFATTATGGSLALEGAAQGDLAGFSLDIIAGVVPAETPVGVRCDDAQSIVPEGYVPISAAIEIEALPGVRDGYAKVRLPFRPALVPAGVKGGTIRIFTRFPNGEVRDPIFVDVQEDMTGGILEFETRIFGTFQAALPADAGQPFDRHYVFRAITGVSMGAGFASLIGFHHPELFDAIGALGGPSDWTYLLHYLRGGGMGGFCTDADPNDPSTWSCDTYTATEEFEHPMSMDNWYFSTGDGTGGAFDRESYLDILQDLTYSFGNLSSYNPADPFLPAGMPLEERMRPWAERCPTGGYTIASGYYDDEYNRDGSLPVIAFCDGTSNQDKTLPFDRYCDTDPEDGIPDQPNKGYYPGPEVQRRPVEFGFAVDYNGNGMRDRGEPVIRNFWEPYEDIGVDGIADVDEPGYDPVLNPDPAGDDYHWAYNPGGTENNYRFDDGEPYEDLGIDGVADTPQVDDGGYDYGEGNGQFDLNPNLETIYAREPRAQLAGWTDAEKLENLRNTILYTDGGIRDIFNFVVTGHQVGGAVQAAGGNVRVYNDFTAMTQKNRYTDIDPTAVDFTDLGDHVIVRYGDPEADNEQICLGDGKHVGETFQTINRLLLMVGFILNQFPVEARRHCVTDDDCTPEESCSQITFICGLRPPYASTTGGYTFRSQALGGTYHYSIAFPPGYEMTQCSDADDNDGDGLVDGDDPDCISGDHNNEGGPGSLPRCSDGVNNDNDINDLIDFPTDPQCTSAEDDAESDEFEGKTYPVIFIGHGYGQGPEDLRPSIAVLNGYMGSGFWPKAMLVFPDGFCGETVQTQCTDGVDNDNDGLIDRRDPDCANGNSETGQPVSICNDGVDNDLDGKIDSEDHGCDSPADNDEADCVQGTFYTNHASYPDGSTPGPAYEDAFVDLVHHLDEHYRTRAPETIPLIR